MSSSRDFSDILYFGQDLNRRKLEGGLHEVLWTIQEAADSEQYTLDWHSINFTKNYNHFTNFSQDPNELGWYFDITVHGVKDTEKAPEGA